jgi:hypothetical protein
LKQRGHAEVLSKETLVDDIRKKGQDLMKRKRGVPGIDMVQQQLVDLGKYMLETFYLNFRNIKFFYLDV